jgi:aspartyl-tRNA(Asn)/glutamyl-tRNA(Gln) amidotransferase subunit A
VHIDAEGALAAAGASAARRHAGQELSPIDGVPIAIKANIAVRGMPWHAGIPAYRDRIAADDAPCVARARAGGAVILGLLNMDEAALGGVTDNPVFGRTQNPWRDGFTAGGSSGGAGAAVAAGLCVAALGTDTLGSVRIPAAYCGVIGHVPPPGAISTAGVVPLVPAWDRVGILARTITDVRDVLAWLVEGWSAAPTDRRIGLLDVSGHVLAPGVAEALARAAAAAERRGWQVQTIALPSHDFAAVRKASLLMLELGAAHAHEAALAANPDGFSPALRRMLAWGRAQTADQREAAEHLLTETGASIARTMGRYALLPTTPHPAFPFDRQVPRNQADFTALANLSGLAATAVPAGLDPDGLPLSVQILSPSDAECLALAHAAME